MSDVLKKLSNFGNEIPIGSNGYNIPTEYIEIRDKNFIRKIHKIKERPKETVCGYCGRKYFHELELPHVIVLGAHLETFEPKVTTEYHDVRQPFKCKGCGASIMLNTNVQR